MTDPITPETVVELRRLRVCLPSALAVARVNASACGDGADGESIALVCNAAEHLSALLDAVEERDRLKAETPDQSFERLGCNCEDCECHNVDEWAKRPWPEDGDE